MSLVGLALTRLENWFPRDVSYDDVVQTIGFGTSAALAVLYFARWYYTTYVLQHEYEFVDFSYSPRRQLTELQELACLYHQDKVDHMMRVISLKQNQFLTFWGSDMDVIDGLIMKTLMDMKCRTMILNFKDAVWVENVRSWMDRMEETSNPIHVIVRNLGALIASLGFSSNALPESESPDEDRSLMLRFRTLLAEKVYFTKKAAEKEPNRPLVVYLSGLERLAYVGNADEPSMGASNKYFARYLEHFVNICENVSPVIVLAGMSDTFWLQHWLKCQAARQKCWSFHVSPIASEYLLQHAASAGSTLFPQALLKDTSISKRIFRTWGTHSRELTRIVRLLASCDEQMSSARLAQYLDTLTHHEVENFLLAWHLYHHQRASYSQGGVDGDDDGDGNGDAVAIDLDGNARDDDEDITAFTSLHQSPESRVTDVICNMQPSQDKPAIHAASLDKSCLESLLRCSWSSECEEEVQLLFRLAKDPHGQLPLSHLCYVGSSERGQMGTMLRLLQRQVLQVTQAPHEGSPVAARVEHILTLRRPVELIALRTLFHLSRPSCGK